MRVKIQLEIWKNEFKVAQLSTYYPEGLSKKDWKPELVGIILQAIKQSNILTQLQSLHNVQ